MIDQQDSARLIVGTKQVMRAAREGSIERAYIARDCDSELAARLTAALLDVGAEVEFYPTMAELGSACGIAVGSACAAVLKNTCP